MADPSFDTSAGLGRVSLLVGAYSPAVVVLGLRVGFDVVGWVLIGVGVTGVAWWLFFLLRVVPRRQRWEVTVVAAEPVDRGVAAYVASYLLPVLAAKPEHGSAYAAYGLAAALILVVAYRADLGAINPLAYLCGFRAYRVGTAQGPLVVLSRFVLVKDASWELQSAAGIVVARREVTA